MTGFIDAFRREAIRFAQRPDPGGKMPQSHWNDPPQEEGKFNYDNIVGDRRARHQAHTDEIAGTLLEPDERRALDAEEVDAPTEREFYRVTVQPTVDRTQPDADDYTYTVYHVTEVGDDDPWEERELVVKGYALNVQYGREAAHTAAARHAQQSDTYLEEEIPIGKPAD